MNNLVRTFSGVCIGAVISTTCFGFDMSSPPNSLVVDASGKIGVGTDSPTTGFNMIHNNGSSVIKLQEQHPTTAKRFQVQLENNGGTGFLFTDTSVAGRQWQVATLSNGSYTTSFIGTGGAEFQILSNGRITMGPGSATNFNLQPGGNLVIAHGSVTATNHITSSSYTVKKDFEKVNADDLMSKLKTLEVTKWRYKDPEVKGLHIGPMAEDFYKMFKLGPDERHVTGTDMASIALIAAKELQTESELLKAENSKLQKITNRLSVENSDLMKRLASLEKLVTNLASSNLNLDSRGATIAFK